jgi:hypothetical protein
MLYDPKWEQQTKADPFTLESLIAWLEKQPAATEYRYADIYGCLICKYLTAINIPFHSAGGCNFQPAALCEPRIALNGFGPVTSKPPYTFGAALTRARAALADAS